MFDSSEFTHEALQWIGYQRSNLFSGGAIENLSVFSLGIMPYITASIIMQLLAVVIPKLQSLQEEGESGRKVITQWTRYLTVAIGCTGGQHRSVYLVERLAQRFREGENPVLIRHTELNS